MKHCLIIMPILFRGGSEKQIRYVIEAISQKNLPLTVIVESSDKSMMEEEKAYEEKLKNVSFIFLGTDAVDAKYTTPFKKYYAKFRSLQKLIKTIKKVIKENKTELAMVTNLTGLVLLPWFRRNDCEVIYNERNPGVKVCSAAWKRKLLKSCKKLVCNSKYASKYMSEKLGREVEVINNGIREMQISYQQNRENDAYTIIVPARISHVKNQKVILEAVNILKQRIAVRVIFAGVIEDESYYEELLTYCKNNHLEKEVEFIGFTSNIYDYYAKSDLLVLASFEEGTPNVMLEAFMCKLKVLASDIPMNSDCMTNRNLLFDPNDGEELAKKVLAIKNTGTEEMNAILEENYQFVCNNYSIENMGKKYIDLLYA